MKDDLSVRDCLFWRHCFLLFPTFMSSFSYFYVIVFLLSVSISSAIHCYSRNKFFWELVHRNSISIVLVHVYFFIYLFNNWAGSPAKYIPGDKILYVLYFDCAKIFWSVPLKNVSANGIFAWTTVRNRYKVVVHNSWIPVRYCYKIVGHYCFDGILVHSIVIFSTPNSTLRREGKQQGKEAGLSKPIRGDEGSSHRTIMNK